MVAFPTFTQCWHQVGNTKLASQPFANHFSDWLVCQCWPNVGKPLAILQTLQTLAQPWTAIWGFVCEHNDLLEINIDSVAYKWYFTSVRLQLAPLLMTIGLPCQAQGQLDRQAEDMLSEILEKPKLKWLVLAQFQIKLTQQRNTYQYVFSFLILSNQSVS